MNETRLTDTQIRAAFTARAEGTMSTDLAERISAQTQRARQLPRLLVLPGGIGVQPERLLWAAAISATSLALVGGLLFAGRQPDDTAIVPPPTTIPTATPSTAPEPSDTPSVTPEPSVGPTSDPTAAPTNPPVDPTLDLESFAVTQVDGLRVRSQPTVAESSAKLEPLLPSGVRLFVIEESVAADGYAWYHVMPADPTYPSGWVAAASRDGEPWIAAEQPDCPSLPLDMTKVQTLGVFGGLACFGNQPIQITGELSCQAADVDHTISGPSWLAVGGLCELTNGNATIQVHDGGMGFTDGPGRLNGIVTGHFADPESSTCVWAVDPPAPDPTEVTTTCRSMFVGTEWVTIPID